MAGRKRKAPGLKVINGTSKRGGNAAHVPQVEALGKIPEPPTWLSAFAEAEWRRLAPVLTQSKILNENDIHNLAAFCHAYSLYVSAAEKVNEFGPVVDTPQGGMMKNPAVAAMADASRDMRAFGGALGLDPTSRSRMAIGGNSDEKTNPFLAL